MHIIQDSREQKPLVFDFFDDVQTTVAALSFGDYALVNHQNEVLIERKRSTGELANNLVKEYDRFCRELDKTQYCTKRYIICEFTYQNLLEFPKNSGIPFRLFKYLRVSGALLRKRIAELTERYDLIFCYCGDAQGAAQKVIEIFKEIEQNEKL